MEFCYSFLVFSISLFSFQCKKYNPNSDSGLPSSTEAGQGIFACKLNGEPWISKMGRPNIGGGIENDSLDILGTRIYSDGHIERLIIRLNGLYRPEQHFYQLNDTTAAYALYYKTGGNPCFSQTNKGYGNIVMRKGIRGTLRLTRVDTSNRIMAGAFEFYIPTDFCDTIKITNGRFDIRYRE